jgi:hypothetical protein
MEGLGSNPTLLPEAFKLIHIFGLTMTLYQLHVLYAGLSGPHTRLIQVL